VLGNIYWKSYLIQLFNVIIVIVDLKKYFNDIMVTENGLQTIKFWYCNGPRKDAITNSIIWSNNIAQYLVINIALCSTLLSYTYCAVLFITALESTLYPIYLHVQYTVLQCTHDVFLYLGELYAGC